MNGLIFLVLIVGLAALGWLVWSYMQQNAKLLQTRTVEFAGGLRFEAHTFSVEMHQTAKCVKVNTQPGNMKVTVLKDGTEQQHAGVSDFTLPAAGLRVAVERTPATADGPTAALAKNTFDIVLSAPGELSIEQNATGHPPSTVVRVQGLPEPVAKSFQTFASRLSIWSEKLTKFAEQDKAQAQQAVQDAAAAALEAQAKAEAEAAQAAQAAAAEQEAGSRDFTGQIAKWRKAAGFSGKYSEVGMHDKGGINWFIDLDPDGRITLHGNKRTVYTTLHGASIKALPKAIEIGVRDEFWSDGDPLLVFQVLQGSPPNERRQWQEWLEAARNRIDISLRKGY